MCSAPGFAVRFLVEAQTRRKPCEGTVTPAGNIHFAGRSGSSESVQPARFSVLVVVFQISIQSLVSPSSSVMPLEFSAMNSLMIGRPKSTTGGAVSEEMRRALRNTFGLLRTLLALMTSCPLAFAANAPVIL